MTKYLFMYFQTFGYLLWIICALSNFLLIFLLVCTSLWAPFKDNFTSSILQIDFHFNLKCFAMQKFQKFTESIRSFLYFLIVWCLERSLFTLKIIQIFIWFIFSYFTLNYLFYPWEYFSWLIQANDFLGLLSGRGQQSCVTCVLLSYRSFKQLGLVVSTSVPLSPQDSDKSEWDLGQYHLDLAMLLGSLPHCTFSSWFWAQVALRMSFFLPQMSLRFPCNESPGKCLPWLSLKVPGHI